MEPATFRPPLRGLGAPLALGAGAGVLVGLAAGVPPVLAALFGGLAAAIALTARHTAGLRVVAGEGGLEARGSPAVLDPDSGGPALRGSGLSAGWGELRLGFGVAQRERGAVQRYAIVADAAGRSFAFCEPGPGGACPPVVGADGRRVALVELRDAPLLLGLVVQRVPAWHVLPESLRERVPPVAAEPLDAAGPGAGEAAAPGARRASHLGLWGLAAKLGSKLLASFAKLGTGALKAVKTANVGWAAASAATYSLLFSWKFALALMVQLFIHEYGHVHAMRRTGMRVRGLYFVPLLGAAAVTDDAFSSRRQQVYVALNGPLWGALASLAPAALWWWTGEGQWAAVTAWWALINLFNLLPITPLDGGRVMHAFSASYSSGLGVALSALGLAAAAALATALGFSLLWLVVALGAMELAGETQARAGARALRLLPEPARFGVPQWLYLRAVLGGGSGSPADLHFLRALDRQEKTARAAPLSGGQLVRWGLAYAGLAAALVLLVWLMRHVPGADLASKVLE